MINKIINFFKKECEHKDQIRKQSHMIGCVDLTESFIVMECKSCKHIICYIV